ncbi:MAG: MBL fold metallo-hydrolase, partial [Clostridia bacterium]|nr:MBL fold metallo-hydrolase [Clostridia bacterium]
MAKNSKKSKKKISPLFLVLIFIVCLILGAAIGAGVNLYISLPKDTFEIPATERATATHATGGDYDETTIKSKELSIHFLENGTKYAGDCTLIKVGNTEVLIDAGAKPASIPTLRAYIDRYCEDKVLEYVIVTHAHEDHYAGFATTEKTESIFDIYECETIITFAQTTSNRENTAMYKNFKRELNAEIANGAKWYKADEVAKETYNLGSGVSLEILDSKFYREASTTENNHSVCTMIHQGNGATAKHYLFTGDLEKDGEDWLAENNDLPKVELYKAGHHGSKTSSNEKLMAKVQPKNICVCCCAGSPEYTKTNANQFPTQAFVDRVAEYTENVYVTTLCVDYDKNEFVSMNGNVVFCANGADTTVTVYCSNNYTLLKDTDWFKANRTAPDEALVRQLNLARDLVKQLGLAVVAKPGIEADDLMAFLAREA